MKRRILGALLLAAPLLAAAPALLASCAGKERVAVAFIGSLSGKLTANSTMGLNAIELYLSRPEAARGWAAYTLEAFDDKSDAANLKGIVAEIERKKIKFVIGPLPSSFAKEVFDRVGDERILQISPLAAADMFEGRDDYFIKMYPSIRAGADQLAEHVAKLGLRRIVPIIDLSNKDYADIWVGSFAAILAGRTEVAGPVAFRNPADVNYARIVEEALRAGPDGALLVTNTFDGSMICQTLRKKLPSIALASSSWALNSEFLSGTGRSSEGTLFSIAFDAGSRDERYLRFRSEYKARFLKDVNDFVPCYCYEAIQMLDEAIAAARSADPARVKAAILRIGTFRGLQGDFTFDRYGDAKRAFRIVEVKDGAYSIVE